MTSYAYGFSAATKLTFQSDSDLSVTNDTTGVVLAWMKSGKVQVCRYKEDGPGTPVDTGIATSHAPSIVKYADALFLFWVTSNQKVQYTVLDPVTMLATKIETVPIMATKSGVATAIFKGQLVLLHIGKTSGIAGRTIYQMSYDLATNQWSSKDSSVSGNQSSKDGPAVVAAGDLLFMIHRGKTDGVSGTTVYFSTNSGGEPDHWSKNKQIAGARAQTRPGAGALSDYVVVVHNGNTTSGLRLVYSNASQIQWVGDEQIGDGYSSGYAPAVTSVGNVLAVFFVDGDGYVNVGTSMFSFKANLYPAPLTVNDFMVRSSPGNVAVCLSGGGSRALSAGMGQLLALEMISAAPEEPSLLAQTRMISAVSGGAWLASTFTYLPTIAFSDQGFLGGPYIAPSSLTMNGLEVLPTGCVGNLVNGFSSEWIGVIALGLLVLGIPPNMIWQWIVGDRFLAPYGLFPQFGPNWMPGLPAGYFTADSSTQKAITDANPSMKFEKSLLVATSTDQPRPFFVCNSAIVVTEAAPSEARALAPVQSTPYFAGVVGTSGATDANGRTVGNGGVSTFAFSSVPKVNSNGQVTVVQGRHWTLAEAVGTSSCFFGETALGAASRLAGDPEALAAALATVRAQSESIGTRQSTMEACCRAIEEAAARGPRALSDLIPDAIVPEYLYWPTDVAPPVRVKPTHFVDGGSLENLGVASALSFGDIDGLIVFVNTPEPLKFDGSTLVVDGAIPPLFGYQPYDPARGYVLYADGLVNAENAAFQHNQVFASDQFQPLLDALAQAWNSNAAAALASQVLAVLDNAWFGVTSGRSVKVVWFHLAAPTAWSNQLTPEVATFASDQAASDSFPYFPTLSSSLDPEQVNLLSNLTAWTALEAKNQLLWLYGLS